MEVKNMANTTRGSFSEKKCGDCGKMGCCFVHHAPLVPEGEISTFCWFCGQLRQTLNRGKPLGISPPGEEKEFKNSYLKITTKNGFVYRLEKPNEDGLRRISCKDRNLYFSLCKILLLEMNESFCVWEYNPENMAKGLSTSLVVKIEKI